MHATQYDIPSDQLAGRVILVTGATQGVGRAVALAAARHDATVVLLARNIKRLEAVYDEIVSAGCPEPAAIPLDLLTASDDDLNATNGRIVDAGAPAMVGGAAAIPTLSQWGTLLLSGLMAVLGLRVRRKKSRL